MLKVEVDWNKLTQIEELAEYFKEDIVGFQKLIEQDISQLQQFSQSDLDKLAQLRVLEVTNGCVQWGFRRKDEHSLSVDETRKCMKMVMGFIKEKKFYFPSKGMSSFNSELNDFIDSGRELYQNAFKNNVPGAKRQYYALSTAQFIVYGRPRLEAAIALVKQDYEALFSPYFTQRGRNYIAPYLACI